MRLLRLEEATMQDGQLLHLLMGQTLDASVGRMDGQRHLGLLEPVAQRFGIDGQELATVHQRKCDHDSGSFRVKQQIQGRFPGKNPRDNRTALPGIFPWESWMSAKKAHWG